MLFTIKMQLAQTMLPRRTLMAIDKSPGIKQQLCSPAKKTAASAAVDTDTVIERSSGHPRIASVRIGISPNSPAVPAYNISFITGEIPSNTAIFPAASSVSQFSRNR